MEITLDRRHIKAALVVSPKADVRYYLNGFLLEVGAGPAGTYALIVATDGHRLTCSHAGTIEPMPAAQIIVPRALAESVVKHKLPKSAPSDVTLRVYEGDKLEFTMPDGATYGGKAIEGRYPDWRRVTRQKKGNGKASGIDPRYYGAMHDYFSTLRDFKVTESVGLPISVDYQVEAAGTYAVEESMIATCESVPAFMIVMPRRGATDADFGMVRTLCERPAAEDKQAA